MTMHEFLNELARLHCIDCVPELSVERAAKFIEDPVGFLLRSDDETREAIWRAMEADRIRMQDALVRNAEQAEAARDARDTRNADRIDGYDRDDLGESPYF